MNPPNKPVSDEAADVQSEWHEPFPEPQTIPSGWDLSGLAAEAPLALTTADSEGETRSA